MTRFEGVPPGGSTTTPGPATPGPAEGESLAEFAARVLRDRIVLVELAPGDPIDDVAFGAELGVGRTPVREAVKLLEAERLVTVFPRRGTFAAPVELADLAEISAIRAELEPLAAARAAAHATEADRARMRALIRDLVDLDSPGADTRELLRHDLAVHRAIHAASVGRHLAEVLTRYGNLATRMWVVLGDRLDVADHLGEHVDLLEAVVGGDAGRAATLARHHVTSFEDMVRAAV